MRSTSSFVIWPIRRLSFLFVDRQVFSSPFCLPRINFVPLFSLGLKGRLLGQVVLFIWGGFLLLFFTCWSNSRRNCVLKSCHAVQCAWAHKVNLLLAKVQRLLGKSCQSFKLCQRTHWLSCLYLGWILYSVTWQFVVTLIPLGLVGSPCCGEEKGLLWSLVLHHRHWLSLGRTREGGNTSGKGESESSSLEARATASNLLSNLGGSFLSFQAALEKEKVTAERWVLSAWVRLCAW